MEENRIAEVFAKTAQQEAEALGLFEQRFDKQFPMPETPDVKLMNAIGWQFIATIVQSVASVILASLRTAQMFYDAAAGAFWAIQYLEAGSAILAVELGIVIFSTIKSEAKNRAQRVEDLNATLDISVRLLNTGIIAGLIISGIAGLGVSLKGFGIDTEGFKLWLAITMGLGASIIAWVSGDILGAILARFGNARLAAQSKYDQEMQARVEQKNKMWENAPERKIARSELQALLEWQKVEREANKPAPVPQPTLRPKASTRNSEIKMKIYNVLDINWDQNHDITLLPGPTKLMEEMGVAKGYASDVIKAWIADRGILTEQGQDPDAAQ
jgi:hypothetical protein